MESGVAGGKRSECAAASDSRELSALGHCVAGAGDDWGAQNVENPNCRILSMHAVERDGALDHHGRSGE